MQRRSSLCLGVAAAALLLAGSGCGSSGTKVYKVSGKVTLDGKPVAGASVKFEPVDSGQGAGGVTGLGANGTTGTDGIYSLTTFNTNDGAMAGRYKVMIRKDTAPKPLVEKPNISPSDPDFIKQAYKQMIPGKGKSLTKRTQPKDEENDLPAEYGDIQKTPWTVTVPGGTYDFPLKKSGGT
jgi:hypothetical protein